ncbi:Anhydro-N-acetylmuramic acid kinase [Aspergillus avenaceus]|uniref:Anhydro-N-acetylmuramic acid kinase n=1 Tax=Aspergillus avenaceus TaxID=36643 RepID=A0A5N6U1A3_ASPAV|nr:Anhydro-N-acetylmuramic acid kinase [Aspergillus avenaceus]
MPYIVGLNSGSSFDGVDAVLCTINIDADGHPSRPQFVDGLTVDWPTELQPLIMKAFENDLTLVEMTRVNYAAGALYAQATNALLAKAGICPSQVEVLGYDGQTIYQEPPNRLKIDEYRTSDSKSLVDMWTKGGFPCGLFIAESGVVAALTNITTVTQFRPVDHALGGSGAPLMQYLDFVSFRHEGPTVTLNIGGIANLQLADQDRSKMMAFDTGPGNVMLDHVTRVRTGNAYDRDGELASCGQIIQPLLAELQAHEFFSREPPRSAWRLDFGSHYANNILDRYATSSTEDLLATLAMFTATSIERALVDFIIPKTDIRRVIASGGGTRNATLMRFLTDRLAQHSLQTCTSDAVGLPAAYKEAIKFATLAFATKNSLANNIPSASGASSYAVLGKMTFAPRLARGTEPLSTSVA